MYVDSYYPFVAYYPFVGLCMGDFYMWVPYMGRFWWGITLPSILLALLCKVYLAGGVYFVDMSQMGHHGTPIY